MNICLWLFLAIRATEAFCPRNKMENCFVQAFSDIKTHSKFGKDIDCNLYHLYQVCFRYLSCSEKLILETAVTEYRYIFQKPISAHTIIALNGFLNQKCSVNCFEDGDHICKSKMTSEEQNLDEGMVQIICRHSIRK